MLDISKEHYQDFKDIFKKEKTERDRPGLRFHLEVTETDKNNKFVQQSYAHYVQNRGLFTLIQNLQKPSH